MTGEKECKCKACGGFLCDVPLTFNGCCATCSWARGYRTIFRNEPTDSNLTREICKICHHVNAVGFSVSDEVWCSVVPEQNQSEVVCLGCFTRLGDENRIAWESDIEFFPVSAATHLSPIIE